MSGNESLNIDLDAAREEFYNRDGGAGKEAKAEALLWLERALPTLNYANEGLRADAWVRGLDYVRDRYKFDPVSGVNTSILHLAENFFNEEQAKLAQTKE